MSVYECAQELKGTVTTVVGNARDNKPPPVSDNQ